MTYYPMMTVRSHVISIIVLVLIVGGFFTWLFWSSSTPERCRIIDGTEIVTRNCIPYCPPDPKECG